MTDFDLKKNKAPESINESIKHTRKKKVLIIAATNLPIPAYKGGATETLVTDFLNLASADEGAKNEIQFDVYSNCAGEDFNVNNVHYHFIRQNIFDKIRFRFHWFVRQLTLKRRYIPDFFPVKVSRNVDINEYDLVLLEGNKDQAITARKVYQGVICLHIHTVMTLTKKIYKSDKTVGACDYLIANSNFTKRILDQIDESRRQDIKVLKNAIQLSDFVDEEIAFRKEFRLLNGISEDDFVFIYCGRLERGKGVLQLIKAFKKIGGDAKLIVVGASWFSSNKKSPYIYQLEKEASDVKEKIVFTGYVKHDLMNKYYRSADAFVMPSIYEEAAGLVAIEAQAAGLPVIASRIGGIPEYLPESTSLLVNVAEEELFVNELAQKMNDLRNNSLLYQKEVEMAKRSVKLFGMQDYYQRMIKLLNEMVIK